MSASTMTKNPVTGRRLAAFATRYLGVGAALVILVVIMALTQENFMTVANIMNILRTNSVLFIVAVGLTFEIICGGLDLSVGSRVALGGVFLAAMLGGGIPAPLAVLLTIVACTALGAIVNGGLIAYGGFNFFVVTLAMLELFRGAALVLSNGIPKSTMAFPLIQILGDGSLNGFPIPVLLAISVGVIGFLVLRWTRFGRSVYAVGGNATASRLAGVDVKRIRFTVYAIAALSAGIAAILLAGRLTSSPPVSGALGLELSAAAAVLLGGASFSGGSGNIGGTAIGVLFLGVVANAITLAGVPSYWQGIATGIVLVAAIALDRLRNMSARFA